MTETAPRRFGFAFWSFIAFMAALTALFAGLGVWQVERLSWKEALIAQVTARSTAPPVVLPAATEWPTTDFGALAFAPVTLTGIWVPSGTVLVFTSLTTPKGPVGGPGYWVVTPFAVPSGTVFVNRGFIPQAAAEQFKQGGALPAGEQHLSGVLVAAEAADAFTPAADTAKRIDWIRNPSRLAALASVTGPVMPALVDLPATKPGDLPQGGETIVDFPNNHLGYAMTWFGFALLTPALLAAWIWQRLRRPAKASP